MCTVSWLRDEDGYQLFCNRDEKRDRASALPPRIRRKDGVRFVAPVDGAFGGTWILANEHGVTLCLLNGACLSEPREAKRVSGAVSRGLLLMELAPARSVAEVCCRVGLLDLSRYPPFTLAALEPGLPASIMEWDGVEPSMLLDGDACMPLASSSFDAKGVRQERRQQWRNAVLHTAKPDAAAHYLFHEQHGRAPGPYSPCMHRDDAETVSFSWVRAGADEIEFFYSPNAPCRWAPGTTVALPLV